jgi:hypothetical protein
MNLFENRKLIIATMHGKESVIAPVFEREMGVKCFVDKHFDTDLLGTFSGEIERLSDPISTARKKCLLAMEQNNCDLGIASEGSFGQHPSVFFATANEEILIFIDKKNNLEIIARELSTETNFNGKLVHSESALKSFAREINFPSHALILRNEQNSFAKISKGIDNWEKLLSEYRLFKKHYSQVYVETDMRAMKNPTRMKIIEQTAEKLITKILCSCPTCFTPGFSITSAQKGLPCESCHLPTESTLYYLHSCKKCNHEEKEYFPRKIKFEDPMYCQVCNP